MAANCWDGLLAEQEVIAICRDMLDVHPSDLLHVNWEGNEVLLEHEQDVTARQAGNHPESSSGAFNILAAT